MKDKYIGGYFPWEFTTQPQHDIHKSSVALNSGHHALEYILRGLGDIKHIYVPYYTCDFVLHPIKQLHLEFSFYHINERLEMLNSIPLKEGEYLIYTNYFGIKDNYISQIVKFYGERLIVDNAQALFSDIIGVSHQFYSPRKFAGIPDGGFAKTHISNIGNDLPYDKSNGRCSHLLKRIELEPSDAYSDFYKNNMSLLEVPMRRMSQLTRCHISTLDWGMIKEKRRKNFSYIHNKLKEINLLDIPSMDLFECPLIYPLRLKDMELKKYLIENNIYVATYWPNVFDWCDITDFEAKLTNSLIAIPIDQRYDIDDMNYICEKIISFTNL